MDPVTMAIVAALAAGATAGIPETGKRAIGDAYDGLKALIQRKFGDNSEIAGAVASLEGAPDSKGHTVTLTEEVAKVKADQDREILAAAQALLQHINQMPGGTQHTQQAIGQNIAQADRGSTATVNVGRRDSADG